MSALWYLCGTAAGYLIGCLNVAALLAKAKGFDIRSKGSHNAGASNALVTMGKGAAVCSALTDIFKAFLPVWLLLHVIPLPEGCAYLPVVTGIAVICGHMFPFWMQFRGGKGFASLLGLTLALDWRCFLIQIGIVALMLFTVRYIVPATVSCSVLLPVWRICTTGDIPELLMLILLAVLIIYKHIPNLRRIADGTEIKFREKHTNQKNT